MKVLRISLLFFRNGNKVLPGEITNAFVQSGHTCGGVSRCQINLYIQTSGSNGCVHFVVVQIHGRPHWIWYKFGWMEKNVSLSKLFDSSIKLYQVILAFKALLVYKASNWSISLPECIEIYKGFRPIHTVRQRPLQVVAVWPSEFTHLVLFRAPIAVAVTIRSLPMPVKNGHAGVMKLNTPSIQTPAGFCFLFSKMCIRNSRRGVWKTTPVKLYKYFFLRIFTKIGYEAVRENL